MSALLPDVAIVSHNTDYYLLNLLRSLEPLHASKEIGDIHVWDNASSDRTTELLGPYAAGRPWLRVWLSDVNAHHGPALDTLLRECCRSDWVLVLDADTEVARPFGAGLARLDVRDAAFVGQVHPQMPTLYAYLAHLLVHRERYRELPPFRNHGAPGIDYFGAVEKQRRPYVRFRWSDYVTHFGQGALRRLVERGETGNPFYRFAAAETARSPKSAERVGREGRLSADLDAFLSATEPRRLPAGRSIVSAPNGGASGWVDRARGSLRLRPDELLLSLRAPHLARGLKAARRLGLVQRHQEAVALARLVDDLRPGCVLEIGTAHGGSFLLWARAAAPDATLLSIGLPPWELDDPAETDVQRNLARVGRPRQSVHLIRGSSHDEAVRARARDCLAGRPVDFLFINGDHSYEGVRSDFHEYAAWVRSGGLIALHDIHPHSKGWGGEVPAFWRDIRDRFRHVEIVADPRQDGFGIGVLWV